MAFNVLPLNNAGISPAAPNTYRNQCSYLRSQDISTDKQTIDNYLVVNNVYGSQIQCETLAVNANLSLGAQLQYDLEQLITQNCVKGIVAGDNITVDSTNPNYPIVSSTGGGGGSSTFEGFNVHLPLNLGFSINSAGEKLTGWVADFSPQFYTSPNLSAGIYTAPQDGHYMIKFGGAGSPYVAVTVNDVPIQSNFEEIQGLIENVLYLSEGDEVAIVVATNLAVTFFKLNDGVNLSPYPISTYWSITLLNSGSINTSFQGISVVLDGDYSYVFPDTIGNWATPESIYYSDSSFDLSTGIFTAPESGHYQFTLNVCMALAYPIIQMMINGTPKQDYITSDGANASNSLSGTVYLNKDDTMSFRFSDDTSLIATIAPGYGTWLNINKLNSSVITTISGQTIVESNILYSQVIGSNIKTLFNPGSDTYICNSIFAVRDLSTDYSGGDGSLAIYFTPIGSTPYDARVTVGIADSISTFSYNLITVSGEAQVVSGPITAQVYGSGTDYTAGNCYIKMVLQKIG